MRLGLTARLVLTVVALAVTVVVLDTALTRWAFQHGFMNYVQAQEEEVLERLADQLALAHDRDGNWQGLDLRRELRVLRGADRHHPFQPPPGFRRPPSAAEDDDEPAEARELAGMDRWASLRLLRSMLPRLELRDAGGRVVFGPPGGLPDSSSITARPVVGSSGRIGTLRLVPMRELAREPDRRFARDLGRMIWGIAAAAALLAGLVGWWLGRRLLAPVSAVAAGARELADGNYALRLPDDRGDELGALARDFNQLAASLAAARDARQRWLADVAHELRTPLAVLRAEIDALSDGIRPLDAAALASLAAEIMRLSRLVDDLHQLSLADAGALSYRSVTLQLGDRVRDCTARFETRMADAGLDFCVETPAEPIHATIDPDRFDQLLGNLLENALRYTDAPGPVQVRLEARDGEVLLTVDDGPPGVPGADLERLFERFARLESSRSRETGGAGLGLAIVRRIAEGLGGSVRAERSDLGGLRVVVRLPHTDSGGARP